MKRISLYMILSCIVFGMGISDSFAVTSTLSSAAPIVGTGAGENAGVLIFNYETGVPAPNEVSIDANTLLFTGTFWSENAGWITFSGLGTNGAKLTGTANNMPMTGFAWSENAGWISFNPRNVIIDSAPYTNSDVFFDKTAGKFHGFAWSENLGWINMEGLMTDITAPNVTMNFKPFSASGSKVFTITDPSPVIPTGGNYTFVVENWDTTATTSIVSTAAPSFTHDFRKAKLYHLKITDPFGNSSEGNVQVVADVPSDTLNAAKMIGGAIPSAYTSTFADSKVADATDVHSMNLKLRDQYGNPVITVPGIKTVNVSVAFNNNVDKNQSLSAGVIGDAIQFPGNTIFSGLSFLSGSVGTGNNTTGDYSLDISSYAPTKAGYAFTNTDNISLQKLTYRVTAETGNSWVGEVGETDKKSSIGTNNLKFSPALYIGNVTNADNWAIRQGYATAFSATLVPAGTTTSLVDTKVAHILDIDANILITYQDPSNITGGTKVCDGYSKTVTTFSPGVYTITPTASSACSRPDSSNILMTPTTLSSTMGFSWTPKIIYAAPKNSTVKYSSEISYKNGGVDIKYPSYARSTDGTALADGTTVTASDWVVNQSVKILGMTNARNTIDVLQGNDTNKIGSLTRTDIKNAIHKNVEIMTKGGISPSAKYVVYSGNKTISSWPDNVKDTIIVKWGNLTITGDITGGTSIRGIIVFKNDAGNGGNIYIHKNVQKIAAVLYADKSIVSWDGTVHYSDIHTATGQLFLEGSVISDNTIGGASMTPLKCPYGAGTCDDKEAKRYDLNYFRFYSGTGATSPGAVSWVPAEGIGYPFVIKYDTRLQTAPPPGFAIIR